MKALFKISPFKNQQIQQYADQAIKELDEFFETKWIANTPRIFVVDDRETINLLRGEETESYVVGWSWGRMAIFILNPENISKESSHNDETYDVYKLIKHELCHSYFQMKFKSRSEFTWINEGVSIFVANQFDRLKKPEKFRGFIDDKNIYVEAGRVVKIIVDKFGKNKLFEFLNKQVGINNKEKLANVFKEVFGMELEYTFFSENI